MEISVNGINDYDDEETNYKLSEPYHENESPTRKVSATDSGFYSGSVSTIDLAESIVSRASNETLSNLSAVNLVTALQRWRPVNTVGTVPSRLRLDSRRTTGSLQPINVAHDLALMEIGSRLSSTDASWVGYFEIDDNGYAVVRLPSPPAFAPPTPPLSRENKYFDEDYDQITSITSDHSNTTSRRTAFLNSGKAKRRQQVIRASVVANIALLTILLLAGIGLALVFLTRSNPPSPTRRLTQRMDMKAVQASCMQVLGRSCAVINCTDGEMDCISDRDARTVLAHHKVVFASSKSCTDKYGSGCTSLEQIRQRTFAGFAKLAVDYSIANDFGCQQHPLTVTGGTEVGYSDSGNYTHFNGWKLSVRLYMCVSNFIERKFAEVLPNLAKHNRYCDRRGVMYIKNPHNWKLLYGPNECADVLSQRTTANRTR